MEKQGAITIFLAAAATTHIHNHIRSEGWVQFLYTRLLALAWFSDPMTREKKNCVPDTVF